MLAFFRTSMHDRPTRWRGRVGRQRLVRIQVCWILCKIHHQYWPTAHSNALPNNTLLCTSDAVINRISHETCSASKISPPLSPLPHHLHILPSVPSVLRCLPHPQLRSTTLDFLPTSTRRGKTLYLLDQAQSPPPRPQNQEATTKLTSWSRQALSAAQDVGWIRGCRKWTQVIIIYGRSQWIG